MYEYQLKTGAISVRQRASPA